jgi:hypothetical protein
MNIFVESRRGGLRATALFLLLNLCYATVVSEAVAQPGTPLPGLVGDANNMGDLTENNGTITAILTVPDSANHSPGGELPENLIDNQAAMTGGTKWLDFRGDGWEDTNPADGFGANDVIRTVEHVSAYIELETAAIVGAYTITSANDTPTRDPFEWTLAGTNVVNPVDTDFVQIHSITGADFPTRFHTRVFEITPAPTTAYKTYRFNFITEAVATTGIPAVPPPVFDANVIQIGEIELLTQFVPSDPRLEINRATGAMTLINATPGTLNITGYSITSAAKTLNSNTWLSMHNNYDGNSGGSLDTDNWIRLTATNGRGDLSEVENPNGTNGVVLASSQSINLGNAWIKYPSEDLQVEILLADGTTKGAIITYIGNNNVPFVFGDLNFSGGAAPINSADWNAFKQGQSFNFSTVHSAPESYSHGDLDGDFDFDLDDFGIFKATFDAANGAGAFVAMLASIPEPGTAALFALALGLAAMVRTRRRVAVFFLLGVTLVTLCAPGAQAGEPLPGLIGGDLTNPDNVGAPDVTITAGDQANSPMNEAPGMMLDNSTATKWLAFQPNGTFYQVQFNGGAQHAVNTYTITSANDAPERDPYRWNLSGSNDGVNFTVIDHQSGNDFPTRLQTQQFVVANNQAYNYYRFDFLTPLGAGAFNPGAPNSIQIAEIELFDDPNPDILTLEVNTQTGAVRIANNSDDTIPFDAYRIRSPGGRLNFANWSGGPLISNNGGQSIHDLNLPGFPRGNGTGNGWEEGLNGSSDFDLTEFYLGTGGVGTSTLGAEQGITMNNIFRTGGAQDLSFVYRSFNQNVRGFVTYIGGAVPGDYNGNGVVDGADYVLWRNGGPLQNEVVTPGVVTAEDYTAWRARFGNTSGSGSGLDGAAAVPEPASWILAVLVPALMLGARRRPAKGSLAGTLAAFVLLMGTASASTLDRDYRFQGNAVDSAAPADNLTENGGPTYVGVQALGRPGATPADMGIQLSAASSQFLSGALGLGSPPEGAPIGVTYPESRLMQVWVRPTTDTGARQEVVSDTFQFGIFISATDTWGHTYGSDGAPANLGDDFVTTAPVTYNGWTHIMQRTFENDGVALYVNGVAVSRFNADYEVNTNAITPTPDRGIYVGAASGGATNFFTGQLDNLKIAVAGAVMGGTDFGAVNLATENDYIAFAVPNMGFANGDVNGDGVVNGTGTGPAATDDVRFFIDHWLAERRVNNIVVGDLTSRTTLGDLNFDGRTSLPDWHILRSAHVGGASLDLGALLAGVPEPSTLSLLGAALSAALGFSRRRRWSSVTADELPGRC